MKETTTTPKGSLPIRDVVKITTGERFTPAYIESAADGWLGASPTWYSAAELKKDGKPKQIGRGVGGWGSVGGHYSSFAYYDPAREKEADEIRTRIAQMKNALSLAQQELRQLYEKEETT